MAKRLTTFSKFLITLLIVGAIAMGVKFLLSSTEMGKNLSKEAVEKTGSSSSTDGTAASPSKTTTTKNTSAPKGKFSDDDDVLKVQVFTWGGYAPGFYFNEGFLASEKSRFYKEYGLKVDFILIDDFDASRNAWKADEVHLLGTTVDGLTLEMEGLQRYNPQVVMQVDWSRGGDAIVVQRGIKSINDLKGKKVAVAPFTPSQTFLLKMLDAANLKWSDIDVLEVPSAIDAATAFKSGKVSAAVVWAPDDEICVREKAGASVIASTREASHIIADVFIAKKEWASKNQDKIAKFYEGWMKGAAEINSGAASKQKAAGFMADGTGISSEDAAGAIGSVRLTNHGDNLNFFGKNIKYKGETAENLYTQMSERYKKLGVIGAGVKVPNWRTVAFTSPISAADLSGPQHEGEGAKNFAPATPAEKAKPAVSSKPISISFATGKYTLDENAKTLVDLQLADIAKSFGNMRVRVEGNTDNVGSASSNKALSEKRAQSVAKYLEQEYGMSRNRFIIVGNGPDKPVPGCEDNGTAECKAKNRRTEFQLIAG